MKFRTTGVFAALVALILVTVAPPALATNGMYLTAYGPETQGRGGANLAISDRSLALNFNPAGISQLQGNHTSASLSLLAPSLEFENMANGPIDAETAYFPLPAVTYVRAGNETPWTWGVGLVAQGGMGAEFRGQNTFFGTVDQTYTEVRFATLSPTVAYAISDDMALGATLNIGYADASFKFFPNTSFFNVQNPEMSFFGVDMDKAAGLQTSLRLGWWWRVNPEVSLGAIYQTETDSDFEDGDMMVNFTGHPFLGRKVNYTADVDGFTFASQAGVGIAWRPAEDWVLALDVKRYFWDSAIDTITVTATDPDVAGAPPEIVLPFVFNWEDQWVIALGGDYRASDRLTLRAGYNYGENPVPDETLNPLFPANTEHHLSAGFSWLSGAKVYEFAIERAFENDQTNNNPDPMVNPFGPGSRVSHEQWTVSFGVSWAWARNGH
jgi:long-chain fatty acid transport protein